MNVTALLRRTPPQQPQLRLPRLRLSSDSSLPTSAQSATAVHISEAARDMAHKAVQPKVSPPEAIELREFLGKFDFKSITPRQLAQVGGRLFEEKAISEAAASAFIGVETNLVEEMNPDKAIDMNSHFQRMLDAATAAQRSRAGVLRLRGQVSSGGHQSFG